MNDDIEKSKKIAQYLTELMTDKNTPRNKEFDQWIETNSSAFDVLNKFSNEEILARDIKDFRSVDKVASANEMFRRLSRKQTQRLLVKISSVAAVLIFVSFGIWYFSVDSSIGNRTENHLAMSDLTENVKIVFENGEEIELNDELDTIKTNNLLLRKNGDNTLAFVSTMDTVSVNQLIVPKRKVYSIVLSDGTRVMLNAESKLTFPNQFTGNTREVTIDGEGYFEVTKNDKIPFIVHSKNVAIRVYGTKFNVNSYDESITETLLVEGSVGVSIGEKQHMLKPNQHSTVNRGNGSVQVTDVDELSKYLAWTNGYFIFAADKLETVIGELSRWYNVNLVLNENVRPDTPITGSFRRDTDLSEIIESLETLSGTKLLKKMNMKE